MSYLFSTTANAFTFTLAPSTPTLIVGFNANRRSLLLQVNGTNPATFKFQSPNSSAVDGFCLDGASATGGEGGSLLLAWDSEEMTECCPVDAVYAYSTLGTSVTCLEGTVAEFL